MIDNFSRLGKQIEELYQSRRQDRVDAKNDLEEALNKVMQEAEKITDELKKNPENGVANVEHLNEKLEEHKNWVKDEFEKVNNVLSGVQQKLLEMQGPTNKETTDVVPF